MNKSEARQQVWEELIKVAKPDSRFHLNFNEYIPDFIGSKEATDNLTSMSCYKNAEVVFITPDICLEGLRTQAIYDGKTQIVSTYGIRRGFVELVPSDVQPGLEPYVVLLDMIEAVGKNITLEQLKNRYKLDLIVTGASAVNKKGVRFGKGHGFFDLEWAMFYMLGIVDENTPVVAFVHDCQLIDLALDVSPYDTLCDYIVTPSRIIEIADPLKPTSGVIWEMLEDTMMDEIPPLQELNKLEELGRLS